MKRNSVGLTVTRLFLAAIGCAAGHLASASGTLCVNNSGDLALALNAAQGTATTIQLARGTYDLKGSVWAGINGSSAAPFKDGSSLLGGYSSDCSGRNVDTGNTTIANSAKTGMSITLPGDATFEGITFADSNGLNVYTYHNKSGAEVLFRRDTFTGVTQSNTRPLSLEWSSSAAATGTFRIVDTLIYGNNNPGNAAIGAVTVNRFTGNPKIEFVNDTIVNNTGNFDGIGIFATVGVQVYLYNTIAFNNGVLDLEIETGHDTTLVNDDIGTYLIPNPNNAPIALLRGNPKLDVDFKPIESPASPVINAGTDSVIGGLPSTDLPGRAREIGSEPDMGAYESSINDSLIQSVTTTNDSGVGSLRAAIAGANANGSSGAIITFAIGSSCGPQVIHLLTPLPATTAETHILGFTQPGASANSLDDGDNSVYCVILDGDTHQIADGFSVANTASNAAALSVNGIAFSGFTHSALNLRGGVGHFINGIRTGGSVGGVSLVNVDYGIILGPGVHGATIGVANDAGSRNVLGGTTANAINIDQSSGATAAAHDNQIVNNYIGVRYSGTTQSTNNVGSSGVSIGGDNNTVQNNTFGFNGAQAIHLTSADAHDNTVTNNLIGTDFEGSTIPNNDGITIDNGAHDNDLSSNIVDNNTGNGVTILGASNHNNLHASEFAGNTGLAIDLGGDGVSPNDNDSLAVGQPNRKQNYPVISSAIGEAFTGTVSGTVTSSAGTYTIDVYASTSCDSSGYGEGTEFIGSDTATVSIIANGQGTGSFKVDVVAPFIAGFTHITATATDASGDTSEFSQCFNYTNDQIFGNGFDPGFIF